MTSTAARLAHPIGTYQDLMIENLRSASGRVAVAAGDRSERDRDGGSSKEQGKEREIDRDRDSNRVLGEGGGAVIDSLAHGPGR